MVPRILLRAGKRSQLQFEARREKYADFAITSECGGHTGTGGEVVGGCGVECGGEGVGGGRSVVECGGEGVGGDPECCCTVGPARGSGDEGEGVSVGGEGLCRHESPHLDRAFPSAAGVSW